MLFNVYLLLNFSLMPHLLSRDNDTCSSVPISGMLGEKEGILKNIRHLAEDRKETKEDVRILRDEI